MTVNTAPIFSKGGKQSWGTLTAANTTKDGTSGTVVTVFTAGADGSFVERIIAMPLGTNVATVARVFLNNGSSAAVAANNTMITQVTCPATTNSEVAAIPWPEIPINMMLPAGYTLFVAIGTAVSAGIAFCGVGGTYTE